MSLVTLDAIRAAAHRVSSIVRRTPILDVSIRSRLQETDSPRDATPVADTSDLVLSDPEGVDA